MGTCSSTIIYFANVHLEQHGLCLARLIVEPPVRKFLDPHTGEPLKRGTQAVIRTADGKVFREFVLFCHDFALLFDQDGNPINPLEVPGSDE